MNRKLAALLLALAAVPLLFIALFAQTPAAPADVVQLVDSSISNFNLGTLAHTELNVVDDGSVALQSIGLAGGWNNTTTTGLPARFFHASTHVGNYIYVFGGKAGTNTLSDAYVATIQTSNHQLSSWRAVTSLPEPLNSAVAVAIGNHVYVIGGFSGTTFTPSNRTYRATVNTADGSLSAWTQDAVTLPGIGLDHAAATVENGYIYVLGGETDVAYSAHVYVNHPTTSTGALSAWVATTDLPGPDYNNGVVGHTAGSYAGHIYIATGLTDSGSSVPDVYSAVVNSNGTLGTWTTNVNYGRNLVYTAGAMYGTPECGANMFLSGGVTNQGAQPTDYVAAAALALPDYLASGWYDTSNLVVARFGHTMVASDDGWLYVIDGSSGGTNPVNSVRFGETACAASGGATRAPSGTFTSRTLDIGQTNVLYSLTWNTTLTPSIPLTMTFAYRFSSTDPNFNGVPFSAPIAVSPGISTTGSITINASGHYVQYQITMAHDPNHLTSTPYLNWVKLAYEGSPPTVTPHPSGTPGPNLVTSVLEMVPYGGWRPSLQHPVTFNVSVRNAGTLAATGHLEADVFMHLTRPPVPGDQSDTFGAMDLPAGGLQPGQEVVVHTSPIQPTTAGAITLYAWANRNHLVQESNYNDDILGPMASCIHQNDGQTFTDVPTAAYFYTPVEYLACRGVISGYADGTFRPYANTTRSQFTKMDTLAVGWTIFTPPGTAYTFHDVPRTFPFFAYVETAYNHGVISGYGCGGPGEPCDSAHRPYFRPYANITRGQLAKIIALSKGWTLLNPTTATFSDVVVGSPFFQFVETVYAKHVVSGYGCGTGCLQYRPGSNGTRGQLSKMLYIAVTQQ